MNSLMASFWSRYFRNFVFLLASCLEICSVFTLELSWTEANATPLRNLQNYKWNNLVVFHGVSLSEVHCSSKLSHRFWWTHLSSSVHHPCWWSLSERLPCSALLTPFGQFFCSPIFLLSRINWTAFFNISQGVPPSLDASLGDLTFWSHTSSGCTMM